MAQPRWLAPWKDSGEKPAIYHVVSRIVDRQFLLKSKEKAKFYDLMRQMESFSGCRVLTYCLMSNHFHLLLEVPPAPRRRISKGELLRRLGALYSKKYVADVRAALKDAREHDDKAEIERIFSSYTYRMNDLSEFMKTLMQRFSSWYNRAHGRRGRLWEQRFTSVIVEGGPAAVAVAAYIELNPVRAGICKDPLDYRWSGYAEAMAGGEKGAQARAGIVRVLSYNSPAWKANQKTDQEGVGEIESQRAWRGGMARRYRRALMGKAHEVLGEDGKVKRRGMDPKRAQAEAEGTRDLPYHRVIRHKIRYFTAGAVLGSRAFVDEIFRRSRERFGPKRKTGARKPRGSLDQLSGTIWSMRDLQNEI